MKPPINVMLKCLALVTAMCFALYGCGYWRSVTEAEASRRAQERFVKICSDFKLDRDSFEGPRVTNVAGFPMEFEWTKRPGSNGDNILIIVDRHGITNVSFVPPGVETEHADRDFGNSGTQE